MSDTHFPPIDSSISAPHRNQLRSISVFRWTLAAFGIVLVTSGSALLSPKLRLLYGVMENAYTESDSTQVCHDVGIYTLAKGKKVKFTSVLFVSSALYALLVTVLVFLCVKYAEVW